MDTHDTHKSPRFSKRKTKYKRTSTKLIKDSPEQEVSPGRDSCGSGRTSKARRQTADSTPFKERRKKVYCQPPISVSTSHTHFYRESMLDPTKTMKRITRDEYLEVEESMSGSSDTYHCVHKPEGRQYTNKTLLKRNLLKILDPKTVDAECKKLPIRKSQELIKIVTFLIAQPMTPTQLDRLKETLEEYCLATETGFNVTELDEICLVLDYLGDHIGSQPSLKPHFTCLLKTLGRPIHLNVSDDILTYFNSLRSFFTFMDYMLCVTIDDADFDLVSKAMIWHLSAPDKQREKGDVQRVHSLAAATTTYQTVARMFAVVPDNRFYPFLKIATILAFASGDNCLKMIKENIFENIFYRLNPYFPHEKLPFEEISLVDSEIKESLAITRYLSEFITLIFVLIRTTIDFLKINANSRNTLPCPDEDAQICFAWLYRYECRSATRRHYRNMLTVIVLGLLDIFEGRLVVFSSNIMGDIMTMSVLSELPRRDDWLGTIPFNAGQDDAQFKHLLIILSVKFLQLFPINVSLMVSLHWVLGLMYLLDPGLASLKMKWSSALFALIRKTSLQALMLTIPLSPFNLTQDYGLIKRILWYIEWYPDNPFELSTLYWCLRLLETSLYKRTRPERHISAKTLIDTHGIIVVANVSKVLLAQSSPPMERVQGIINVCLRVLGSVVELNEQVTCLLYPDLQWPDSINSLTMRMLDIINHSLNADRYISDRWLISVLNLIWESVIWQERSRHDFVKENGVYTLLDIITKVSPPVQCLALALICDIARAGEAISHLITWRAKSFAASTSPMLVKTGSTIATLLAAVFRDECREDGVKLTEDGVIVNIDMPLRPKDYHVDPTIPVGEENLRTPHCLAIASMAGSRMSKAFALLQMLSSDMHHKVELLDEAYKLYLNVTLPAEDEVILTLCSHYLTMKLNETWSEIYVKEHYYLPEDDDILNEFMEIAKGWGEEIQRQQNDVLEKMKKAEQYKEESLYNFLSRVRLTTALDALRMVRCIARSSDRNELMHAMLHDAIGALQHRALIEVDVGTTVHRTYKPPIDAKNMTGQHIKLPTLATTNNNKETPENTGNTALSLSLCSPRKFDGTKPLLSSRTSKGHLRQKQRRSIHHNTNKT